MYDASLVRAGVELSTSILARYGRPAPTVLSQRDVPGLTQALVPVLSGLGGKAPLEAVAPAQVRADEEDGRVRERVDGRRRAPVARGGAPPHPSRRLRNQPTTTRLSHRKPLRLHLHL